MARSSIGAILFSKVYPLYVAKAERKGRTKAEVDQVIAWLLGYDAKGLRQQIAKNSDFAAFFAQAPRLNPDRALITGVVCGIRVEDIDDPLTQNARYLDKLIDELAKGKAMDQILRRAAVAPTKAGKAPRSKASPLPADVQRYHAALPPQERAICDLLAGEIARALPAAENKVWHAHPVWFLAGNPIVGYSKLKDCIRLLFWSGQSFRGKGLRAEGKFKAAEARYTDVAEVDTKALRAWLAESRDVQWDYQNIVRRKGRLERLK